MLAAVLGLTAALPVAAGPAQAASTRSTATVADRLVLEPTDRGYRGSLEVDLTYRGAEPGRATYVVTEPIPGSYENVAWGVNCYSGGELLPDGRIRVECDVPGGELSPGEQRTFTVDFQVLTTVQPYAMKAGDGELAVKVDGTEVTDERFSTRFRSTTGSLTNPVRYVQDQQPDAAVTVSGDLVMVRQPEGYFEGRLPVTVRYDSDARHGTMSIVGVNLPAGFGPPWSLECSHECVPGGEFMEGEERTFDLYFSAPPDTPIGDLGQAGVEVSATAWINGAPDSDPADNVATFSIITTEAP
ncbi:hypothetical protein GCE86_26910 [Micromonospora terminaliae]|uniref:Uncharacterized protein n=1 Tax=Micromonospora terminaliae TaxID=1914461 RepID=A0AAJ3DH72_9ACTN|nr:hypothetical protein [Micromonospora terminaliae]NES26132.1 hypothetical protein [Micromonospora terminaliae]QGL50331.1 hypothetical protein GCE86_26910 [Micromonospora terminaliae]